jgi:hypothetical protein
VLLVGFIIRIYHNARSSEYKIFIGTLVLKQESGINMLSGVNVFPFRAQEIPKCLCLLKIGRYPLITVNDLRKWERTWSHIKRNQFKRHFLTHSYCYY